jgi:uncharacterized membrane protein YjjP (DUF1212 family)
MTSAAADDESPRVPMQLIRLEPGSIDLADTTELYGMADALIRGRLALEKAYLDLQQPRDKLYPGWLQIVSGGLVSGSFAVMLASSWQGAVTAALAGILVGLFSNGKAGERGHGHAATLVCLFVCAVSG